MPSSSKTFLSTLAAAVSVAAHGHVDNIVINGVSYAGYDVTTYPYMSDPPVVVGWSTTATDNGFVAPDAYNSSDIICHNGAENAKGHAQVAAGDSIYIQWTAWPESHKGPVLDYLAACSDTGCESVDKTSLEFFKISEKGLVDGSSSPGTYASDQLEDNGNGWLVQIPTDIKAGFYVLRHEIIALHSAENADGAQNYPQCFNLEITGSGTTVPDGTLGTALYTEDEDGIVFNIYTTVSSYPIPGPTMISGATEVTQASSAIVSSGNATTGTALATGSSGSATSAAVSLVETTAAAAATTSAAASSAAVATSAAAASTEAASSVAAVSETAVPVVVASSATSAAAPAQTSAKTGCSSRRKTKRSHKVRRSFTPHHA